MPQRSTRLSGSRFAVGAALMVTVATCLSSATPTVATTTGGAAGVRLLVTRPSGEDDSVTWVKLTNDGRTAFVNTKAELVDDLAPSDHPRVFAVDVASGAVRLVTDDRRVTPLAISGDGRLMLVGYEEDDTTDVPTLLNTETGATRPLTQGGGAIGDAVFSSDGSTAAFTVSRPSEQDFINHLVIADLTTSTNDISLVDADGDLFDPYLSADGSILAFSSYAGNLPVGVGNNGSDAVVLDRRTNEMKFAYTTTDGAVADDQSAVSGMSADGSTVIVRSWATNFDGPSHGEMNYFAYQRDSGAISKIIDTGIDTPSMTNVAAASADGSLLLLKPDITHEVMRYDVASRQWSNIALAADGALADGGVTDFAGAMAMSADGSVVAFVSTATNLGADHDDINDVFVWGAAPVTADDPPDGPSAAPPTSSPPSTPPPSTSLPAEGRHARLACSIFSYLPGVPLVCRDGGTMHSVIATLARVVVRAVVFNDNFTGAFDT